MKAKQHNRSGAERRIDDIGPPSGWRDRRKNVERRRPDVREISFSEWIACMHKKPCETE
ncbi:MAG: hypothetical protein WBV56_09590 [Azonexus sp.]